MDFLFKLRAMIIKIKKIKHKKLKICYEEGFEEFTRSLKKEKKKCVAAVYRLRREQTNKKKKS